MNKIYFYISCGSYIEQFEEDNELTIKSKNLESQKQNPVMYTRKLNDL